MMTKETAADVELAGIVKMFGGRAVLSDFDVQIPGGSLLALLGPSGCGKTTTLRVLAGFESPSSGRVLIGGKDVTNASVRRRGVGVVFQAYSLFPHMTARQNVAYGLRVHRMPKQERVRRADELLELVDLGGYAERYPKQLSGGQQQRVALARALAIRPRVLLLDEPLSALDARVRVQLRGQIRRIQQETGTTTLLVTHDQEEALTMADQVGVMNAGKIEQIGTPAEIYGNPKTAFTSEFVGAVNRIPAVVDGEKAAVLGRGLGITNPGPIPKGSVEALIRPEDLHIESAESGPGVIRAFVLRGALTSLEVAVGDSPKALRVDVASPVAAQFRRGERVNISPIRESVLLDAAHNGTDSVSG